MKITRTLAFMFLLLAYCTVLVHAIVPHHHHDSTMYLVRGEFKHDECCEKHIPLNRHNTEDEHQHEDKCKLQLPVVLRANDEVDGSVKSVVQNFQDYSLYINGIAEKICYFRSLFSFIDTSFPLLYSNFSPGTHSLRRGPPIV